MKELVQANHKVLQNISKNEEKLKETKTILYHQVVVEHVHVSEHQSPSGEQFLYWMLLS